MPGFKRFEDIVAWQVARGLAKSINELCLRPPLSRNFSLRDQLCRAAGSAMSNIAEGYSRSSNRDFAHFLEISRGSAMEVQSHLHAAFDLSYLSKEEFVVLYEEANRVAGLTTKLMQYLRTHQKPTTQPTTNNE